MSVVFYPFATLAEEISIELDLGSVSHALIGDTKIGLFAPPLPGPISIKVAAELPASWVTSVLPKKERVKPPCECALLVRSDESRIRDHLKLKQIAPGKYSGKVVIDPSLHRGEIILSACLYRTATANPAVVGLAVDRGARLAWSIERSLHLSKPPKPPGNQLDVKWKKFSSPGEFLGLLPETFYSFEEECGEPILYLNEDAAEELRALMNYGGAGNDEAHVRDALLAGIGSSVWQTIMTWCVVRLHDAAVEEKTPPDLSLLKPWQAGIVEETASSMYPDVSGNRAIDHLLDHIHDRAELIDLLTRRIPAAAQQRAAMKEKLETISEDFRHV
jgi:hypothetical protein